MCTHPSYSVWEGTRPFPLADSVSKEEALEVVAQDPIERIAECDFCGADAETD